jgi:hypothetical protein
MGTIDEAVPLTMIDCIQVGVIDETRGKKYVNFN